MMIYHKGATADDQAAHLLFDDNSYRRKTFTPCRCCGGELEMAYHEERLYSFKCKKCETITLVKAWNLCDAIIKVGAAE